MMLIDWIFACIWLSKLGLNSACKAEAQDHKFKLRISDHSNIQTMRIG